MPGIFPEMSGTEARLYFSEVCFIAIMIWIGLIVSKKKPPAVMVPVEIHYRLGYEDGERVLF